MASSQARVVPCHRCVRGRTAVGLHSVRNGWMSDIDQMPATTSNGYARRISIDRNCHFGRSYAYRHCCQHRSASDRKSARHKSSASFGRAPRATGLRSHCRLFVPWNEREASYLRWLWLGEGHQLQPERDIKSNGQFNGVERGAPSIGGTLILHDLLPSFERAVGRNPWRFTNTWRA